jgi:c-di-GMP-binding flagellar brake protein YcgR
MKTRAGLRTHLRYPATLTLTDTQPLAGITMDISRGGVCLLLDRVVPLARVCAIGFRAALGERTLPVQAMGQVAYCDPVPDGSFRVGIRFISAEPPSLRAIDELVRTS